MALGDYTPTAWVDGATPAITATTLGHLETKVNELDDNAVPAQALINIKTVDGTGSGLDADLLDGLHSTSFSPISKAYASGLTIGEETCVILDGAVNWTNPGGTWRYYRTDFVSATGIFSGASAGVTSGNINGVASYKVVLFLLRIA